MLSWLDGLICLYDGWCHNKSWLRSLSRTVSSYEKSHPNWFSCSNMQLLVMCLAYSTWTFSMAWWHRCAKPRSGSNPACVKPFNKLFLLNIAASVAQITTLWLRVLPESITACWPCGLMSGMRQWSRPPRPASQIRDLTRDALHIIIYLRCPGSGHHRDVVSRIF